MPRTVLRWVSVGLFVLGLGCESRLTGGASTPTGRDSMSNGAAIQDGGARSTDEAGAMRATTCTEVAGARMRLRPLTPVQYANSVREVFGEAMAVAAQTVAGAHSGFSTDEQANQLRGGFAESLADGADAAALRVMARLPELLPCTATADRKCAETFVDTYATKAFRRPLSAGQRTQLLALFDDAVVDHGQFDVAIAELTSAILQMPEFVYLVESGAGAKDNQRKLDDYELAARLSYLLWDMPPDDALRDAASRGDLAAPEGLKAQAARLMADKRFDAVVNKFVSEWIELKVFQAGEKDDALFPEFDSALADAMTEELSRFVLHAARGGADGLQTLLSGRDTYVNKPLADLYGLPANTSSGASDWKRVTLGPERAGLLTRAAVLSGLAGAAVPSHVRRGKFVRMGLLCGNLGAPPPNAMAMQPSYPPNSTRREQSEILEATSPCGGCHQFMDRIGLAFDDFDAIGRRLDAASIDTSGEILAGGDVEGAFDGSGELAVRLAGSQDVQHCVVQQWFHYSFGRKQEDADACAVERLSQQLDAQQGDLAALFAGIALTDAFRYRSLGAP